MPFPLKLSSFAWTGKIVFRKWVHFLGRKWVPRLLAFWIEQAFLSHHYLSLRYWFLSGQRPNWSSDWILCLVTSSYDSEREKAISLPFLIRSRSYQIRGPFLWPNLMSITSYRPYHQIQPDWGLRLQIWIWWGGQNSVHSSRYVKNGLFTYVTHYWG